MRIAQSLNLMIAKSLLSEYAVAGWYTFAEPLHFETNSSIAISAITTETDLVAVTIKGNNAPVAISTLSDNVINQLIEHLQREITKVKSSNKSFQVWQQ